MHRVLLGDAVRPQHHFAFHQFKHDGFLDVEAVLRLLEDNGVGRIHDFVGDLIATVGGQAVQKDGVVAGVGEEWS